MVRDTTQNVPEEPKTQVIERAVTLELVNDKLNYLIGLVEEIKLKADQA